MVYIKIKNACFKNYINNESKEYLSEAVSISNTLWAIYDALAQYRLMKACGVDKIMSFQHGKLSKLLKEFLVACTAL